MLANLGTVFLPSLRSLQLSDVNLRLYSYDFRH